MWGVTSVPYECNTAEISDEKKDKELLPKDQKCNEVALEVIKKEDEIALLKSELEKQKRDIGWNQTKIQIMAFGLGLVCINQIIFSFSKHN